MLNSLKGKQPYGAAKTGILQEKIVSPSIFDAMCSGLEQPVVAVESYNISVLDFYTTLSIAVQTAC